MTRSIFTLGLVGIVFGATSIQANPHNGPTNVGIKHVGPTNVGININNGPKNFGNTAIAVNKTINNAAIAVNKTNTINNTAITVNKLNTNVFTNSPIANRPFFKSVFAPGIGQGFGIPLAVRPVVYPAYAPVVLPPTIIASPDAAPVADASVVTPVVAQLPATESGLQIVEVMGDGAAKKADLRSGDVIVAVGQTRVQSYDELQKALTAATGEVDIVFVNAESKKVERLPVTPNNGALGVSVVPVELQ